MTAAAGTGARAVAEKDGGEEEGRGGEDGTKDYKTTIKMSPNQPMPSLPQCAGVFLKVQTVLQPR